MFGAIDLEWRRLRAVLAGCVACALGAGAAAGAAWWQERSGAEAFERAESRLAEARGRYAALGRERRERLRFAPLLRQWHGRGRIGEDRPARWAEGARRAASGLLAARHRLGAARSAGTEGSAVVRSTDMSVDLDLRHEGELPEFFRTLEREAGRLFTVSGCRLAPGREAGAGRPSEAAFHASCRLRWRTVVVDGAGPGWITAVAAAEGGASPGGADAPLQPAQEVQAVRGPADPPDAAFGRLFTTPAERARIDAEIASEALAPDPAAPRQAAEDDAADPADPAAAPPRWIHVNGLITRSGEPIAAWIDGRRIDPAGPAAKRSGKAGGAPPVVRFDTGPSAPWAGGPGRVPRAPPLVHLDAGGRLTAACPGQRIDPATGSVIDRGRCRTGPRSERGGFLRKSSRSPLTEGSVPVLH